MQELWQSGVHWDESIPQHIHSRWVKFRAQLYDLNRIQMPRGVRPESNSRFVQIHGFCDASQNAYSACVYIRTKVAPGEHHSDLLCSKSRVAPLKATTLPRLELSAVLLLARLISKVHDSLGVPYLPKVLKWSVFVANRVGKIQCLTESKDWRHVASSQNPADIFSRGLGPGELADLSLWWHGPPFLQTNDDLWPTGTFARLEENLPELRKTAVAATRPASPSEFITPNELSHALKVICKDVQRQEFPIEQESLRRGETIPQSNRLLSLSPFMDEKGLIRVGGRLRNSQLPFDSRHPILLPGGHNLTRLLISREYARNLHAGPQATMAAVRQTFWPLSLRSNTRKIIQKCVICFKANPRHSQTIMAPLPAGRTTVSRPFSRCGVDYAGPFAIREGKRRNSKNHKAYIAIFVCFVPKAVHIEVVSDLAIDAFLDAFKRFISRRGKPVHMFSDNGNNFVGANKQLQELHEFYVQAKARGQISQFLHDQQISWSFIPPNAPHFGGLWEAAVKSAKLHMTRVVDGAHLTFEELQTILCETEAILNSRPITAMSSDPNDMSHLTPGHFLIGTALNSFPSRDLDDVPENRLLRWQRIHQILQHFWRRWSTEYLQSLQQRSKWKAPAKSGSTFYNYKGSHSIHLMAVASASYRFLLVDIGAKGRHSDRGVFKNSLMGQMFADNELDVPSPSPIIENGDPMPYVLVADEAFQLTHYTMRPFPGKTISYDQRIFNYRLSRARRIIENTFGIMVARWRIFEGPINTLLKTAEKIVKACIVLHNFLMDKPQYCRPGFADSIQLDGTVSLGEWRQEIRNGLQSIRRVGSNTHARNAATVRENFKNYFLDILELFRGNGTLSNRLKKLI
ncbi:PREDICTED: uncharacterized protein LOC108762994 [Trachymyrmex cornetzi]|uniref:uncharacterized protein LOC108762994 n=1 Tax=Trachymyrmex cornetzi TaxID=471704 RepID=UPI00084F1C1A|nr:PREDICTED: uncharacterized protein LOC108762994 [Trachymyrmex cornetzi]